MILLARNIAVVTAVENIPGLSDGDYGLGVSVSDCGDSATGCVIKIPTVNPMSHPFAYATHRVAVKTSHYMGYSLTVFTYGTQTTDGSMYGQQPGNFIRPVQDGGNLTAGSWGYIADSQLGDYSVGDRWHNAPRDGYGREIIDNRGWQPGDDGVDERYITYGVNIGWGNRSDSYTAHVRYDVTPQEPSTPAILQLRSGDKCEIGTDCVLSFTGIKLGDVDSVGVDFNGDSALGEMEICNELTVNTQYQYDASCTLPDFDYSKVGNVVNADEYGGVFNLILRNCDGATMNTGHQITYYYQPRIDSVEVLNSDSNDTLTIKDSVGVIDMVSTDSASMMLTDDGDVYLWGNTPLYDGNNLIFDKTMAPTMVKLPDLTNTDRIVDIDTYGNSYYAVSEKGYVYAWGDNSAEQLPLQDNHVGWFTQPVASSYYGPKQTGYKRFARQIAVGNQFGITLNTSESGQLMSSWGRNDLKQLGQDDTNTTFVPGTVVQDSKYRPVVGESYADIIAGKAHALALTSYGRVLSWGAHGEASGGDNRLGFKTEDDAGHPHDITYDDGDKDKNYLRTAYRDEGKTFIDIAVGDNFSMALAQGSEGDDNTYLYTFGADDMGQLGNGNEANGHKAFDITEYFNLGDDKIVGITASGKSAAAWTSGGKVYVWGDNTNGRLGIIGDCIVTAPTLAEVLHNYHVDDVVLGAVNYAYASDGRIIAWGGSYGDDVLSWATGDITDWLANPAYLIKVTGQYLDLGATDIWVDLNDNGLMDEAERPLVKTCDATGCYLQISTLGVGNGDIGANGYSIRAITAGNTNHAGVSNDNVKLKVTKELAGSAAKVTVEKPIIRRQTKSGDVDNDPETEVPSIEDAGEMVDANTDKDKMSSNNDANNADDANDTDDEVGVNVNNGESSGDDADESDDLDKSNENNDQPECECAANDGRELIYECVGNEQCKYACDSNDNDGNVDHDAGKLASACTCADDGLDVDKLLIDDYNDKNLVNSISNGTQVQLIDSRRKGCLNGIGSVDVDNQP